MMRQAVNSVTRTDIEEPDLDFYLSYEKDTTENEDYLDAREKVLQYIKKNKEATIGQISRAFPQHQRTLITILDQLRAGGEVTWEDWRPLPTKIRIGDNRITKTYSHDKEVLIGAH